MTKVPHVLIFKQASKHGNSMALHNGVKKVVHILNKTAHALNIGITILQGCYSNEVVHVLKKIHHGGNHRKPE